MKHKQTLFNVPLWSRALLNECLFFLLPVEEKSNILIAHLKDIRGINEEEQRN